MPLLWSSHGKLEMIFGRYSNWVKIGELSVVPPQIPRPALPLGLG